MKRILIVIISLVLAVMLAACSSVTIENTELQTETGEIPSSGTEEILCRATIIIRT